MDLSGLAPNGQGLDLHTASYQFVRDNLSGGSLPPVHMQTFSDAPAGSGLGSSSTLVVSMLKAYDAAFGLNLSPYDLAAYAYTIEREICGFTGGRQDQYAAAFGGCNFMHFGPGSQVRIEPIELSTAMRFQLESDMVLFFTGRSRSSANVIDDQVLKMKDSVGRSIAYFDEIKKEAFEVRDAILREDFMAISESLRRGWENKVKTSSMIMTPDIEEIMSATAHAGASCGKISGAGGGGFAFFLVPLENRQLVIDCLEQFNGTIHHCHLSFEGAQAWEISRS